MHAIPKAILGICAALSFVGAVAAIVSEGRDRPAGGGIELETDLFCNLQAPRSGRVGHPVPVRLAMTCADGSERAEWATATVDETKRQVTFHGATRRGPGGGAAMVWYSEVETSFTPRHPGTYTLKAWLLPTPGAARETGSYAYLTPHIDDKLDYTQPILATMTVQVTP